MTDLSHDLAAGYAVDSLDPHERAQFDEHLSGCADCRAEVDAIRGSRAATRVGGVQTRAQQRAIRTRRRRRRQLAVLAAALVAAVLLVWRPWSSGPAPVATSVSQVLEASDARYFPGPTDGSVMATVVRSKDEGGAVLVPDVLPDPGAGKTYQMWFVPAEGAPVSAGLLTGTGPTLMHGSVQEATAVALSVEPTGGSPQPTDEPVLVIPVS